MGKAAGAGSSIKIDGFVLAMLAAVTLATLYPPLGVRGGVLHLEVVTQIGIALIFFLHGADLSTASLKEGVQNWRLHVFVQLSTYALFPLIGFVVVALTRAWLPFDLLLGFFYLCALSSTISSSVAMTAMARGNLPGAIFNATLSGLLGMFITPLLVGVLVSTHGQQIPLRESIIDILLTLLLPFALGQLARPWLKAPLARHKALVTRADRSVIVLIVYAAFCESAQAGLWTHYGTGVIGLVFVMTGLLLALVITLTTRWSRRLGFSREDEIAAVFCGSKKSLANGIPIANVLFAGHAALGLIVLPLMVYHQLQLILCTVLARRYAARLEESEMAVTADR
jgi:sodium/bile acid cotransporter 7